MLAATTALPIQLVAGYKGTSEIRLAAESGELAGGCWTWDSIRSTWMKAIQIRRSDRRAASLGQTSSRPGQCPACHSLAKSDEARQLIEAGIQDPAEYYRPYVLPPGTPKARVEILRRAFDATMKDPDFLADAKKANLDIEPVTGSEMEKLVAGRFSSSIPTLVAKLKTILNPS